MDAAARKLVRERAGNRCEYCLLGQEDSDLTHHIEHIVARQHGGSDDVDDLALACHRCNLCKGPNLSGVSLILAQRGVVRSCRCFICAATVGWSILSHEVRASKG